eukprot:CAMPEP_0174257090 /NCGR_PEP_ID=MMETSP0439-20130205/6259_1 /TAXON_ID=0 /ORGANISM="Stereomyxa ramosa, Strain Chinc5" /LENGTH=93 /DNA_ID=CAMNT_0015340007 /DNA_START=218 /DNA_END=499 /DNA_ORIENTATION=-
MVNEQPTQTSYFATVLQVYQGSDSGIEVEMLPQSHTDPCFTRFDLDVYVIAANIEKFRKTPDCFYVLYNMCDYFKLFKDLTAEEKKILAAHSK